MGAGGYAAGAAFFALTAGGSALTAWFLLRRCGPLSGAPRWLAGSVLFTFVWIAVHMLPGIFGVLSRETAALVAVVAALVSWRLRPAPGDEAGEAPREEGAEHRLPGILAVVAAASVAALVAAFFRTEARQAVVANDMLNFHLPLLARWIQTGSMWEVVALLPYDTTGNYPQNGDVLLLGSVLPWRSDAFARLAMLPYVALAGLGVYGLARELGADRGRSALAGCMLVALPIVLAAGVIAGLPDVAMYGTFAAGLVFLLRFVRTRRTSDALLAGLGLGIAFGTKWYAVPAVGSIVLLFGIALAVERRAWRAAIRPIAVVLGAVAVAGGFWLVRNAVESGSPFFPAGWLPVGARSDVGNPDPRTDFPLAHYLLDGDVWSRVILPEELRAFGVGGILLLAGLVVAGVFALVARRRGAAGAAPVLWAVAAALLLTFVYAITPNTASGFEGEPVLVYYSARYLVPAAIPAAAALAWLATRLGRRGMVVDVLVAVAIADGLRRAFDPTAGELVAGVLAAVLLGAALVGLLALSRAPLQVRTRRLAIAGAAAAVVALAGGYALERSYSRDRLVGRDPTIDAFRAEGRTGDRVGITGRWTVEPPSPVHPMFGERFRNRVDYVGEWDEGVNKLYETRSAFTAALRRGRYDWLVVGRGIPPRPDTPLETWAAGAGFRLVAQSPRLALYRAP